MKYDIIIRFNKRILSIALSIVIVFTLFPFVAPTHIVSAAERSAAEVLKPTVNSNGFVTDAKVLEYAGKEWYVIASGDTGVKIAENAVTRNIGETTIVLLAKENWSEEPVRFASTATSTEMGKYNGSNLQSLMNSYAEVIENNSAQGGQEKKLIAKRNLEGSETLPQNVAFADKIYGPTVSEATLWPLSGSEARLLYYAFGGSITNNNNWWLRSSSKEYNNTNTAVYCESSGYFISVSAANKEAYVRPALCLNLTSDIGASLKEGSEDVYVLKLHSHVFTYSGGAEDDVNTITATCINEESACSLDDRKVNLTIVKPARTVFGGSGSEKATLNGLEDFNSATGKSVSASDIKYVGRDGTSYDESTTAPTDAGKYTAKITLNDVKVGDTENGSVTASVDYEIAKADGSISYGSGSVEKTYGDAAFTNTLSHTGDGTVTYSSSNPAVATVDEKSGEVTVARVGNTTIKATVADSNNYSYDSKEASYTLTVNKGSGSISYADASVAKTYGAAAFTNPLTKTGDGTVTYSSSEPTVATVDTEGEVTIVGVGGTTITATVEDTDNCTYAVKEASYTLTVSKSNQTINAADMSLTYGGSGDVEAIITNGDGAISYAVKSGSEDYIAVDSTTGAVTVKSVPTDANTKAYITVTARSTDHYNEATKDVAVTINKATITITANDYNISVGDKIPELTSTECYNVTGLVGDDTLTTTPTLEYSGSDVPLSGTATALNLGTYDIVPTGADAGDNYAIDYVKGTLTINKATPTVTAPVPKELTFNGGDQELVTGGTTSGGEMQYAIGSESGPTGSWSTDIPEETDAGTYYVWYKVVGGSDYSDIEAAPVAVVISPKSIANATVTLNETKYLYDGESHDVAVSSVVLDGIPLTEGTDFSVSGTLSGIDKGTYTVTVTALDDSNYTGETTADWSIGMETPVITPPTSTPITYGQTLGESALNGGKASVGDTSVDGKFTWKASSLTPEVSDSNTTEYEVIFTPNNMESYTTASCFVTVTVNKAASPSDNPAPTPKKELTDNGHPQELVNTVPVTGGTIEYVIGTDDKTPPTSGWGPDIPTASKPGTYYIWYKVVGDENHFDSDPKCIVVTIEKPVYSNYEGDGGKWTKGSTDGLKFTFKRSAEDVTTIEHFAGILVDGKDVAESNYDAVSGSVVITLKAPYLETLSAGEHILTAKFNDGESADAGFTIIEAPAADDNNASKAGDDSKSGGTADSNESKKTDVKNPETGDEVPIGLIMIIGLVSLVGAVWCLVLKKNLKPTKK